MTPYASATSGHAARDEITKMLRRFGCESVGFMDDFENYSILLAFKHRGRQMQLQASAKGWAALYLKENPYTHRRKGTKQDYEHAP
jgi:thiamine biosynthesis lipoprotein ApbE